MPHLAGRKIGYFDFTLREGLVLVKKKEEFYTL